MKRAEPGNGWPLTLTPASLGIGLRAVAVYPHRQSALASRRASWWRRSQPHITAARHTHERSRPPRRSAAFITTKPRLRLKPVGPLVQLVVIPHDWTRSEPATAADLPLWFIAACEDGKETPDFLAGYEIDLRAALDRAASR